MPILAPVLLNQTGTTSSPTLTLTGTTLTATAGTALSGVTVASFTDSDSSATASQFSALITWGDGTSSLGTVAANLSGGFDVSGSHTYLSPSSGTVSINIQDPGGTSTSTTSSVTVTNPLSLTIPSLGFVEGQTTSTSLTFTDSTSNPASDYSAQVTWGDGVISSAVVSAGSVGGSFNIALAHDFVARGDYPLAIAITRNDGVNLTAHGLVTVKTAIQLTNPGPLSNVEGDSVSVSIAHTPSSGLRFSAAGLPPGLAIDPSNGAITGTVALGDASSGPYTAIVSASGGGYSASLSFSWTISTPISWNSTIANQTSTEGDTISLSTGATDSVSGATLHYGAVGLPAGLKISTSTGDITGTVAAGAAANGPYTVTISAADNTYSIDQTFTWAVINPITITPVLDLTTVEGTSVSLPINATDTTSGATLDYTADGLPNGLKISTSTGAITGTVAPGTAPFGPFVVTVAAGDGSAGAAITFNWTIVSPVALTVPADQTNNEGDSPSLTISASDSTSGTITYGAAGLPAGLSISASTGAISGTVASGASASSPYTVSLFATDGTYIDNATFSWTVGIDTPIAITDPGDQSNSAGDSVSLTLTATDSGGTISNWSATGLPTGLSINTSTGAITGTASTGGSWTTTITASDGTNSASVTDEWDVSSPITIIDAGNKVFNAGDVVSVPITATDTASGTLGYSATGLPSGLSISSSTGTISGTLSSSLTPGNYTTTVSATDGTNTDTDSFGWTIYAVSTVTVTNPGTQSGTEGSSISTLAIGTSYSGSGTLTYAALGLPPGLALNPTTGHITGTPAAGDAAFSPYSVLVTATDGTAFDSQSFLWNISSSITISSISDQTTTEGTTISTLTVSASGGSGLVYTAFGLPPGLGINPSNGHITGTVPPGAAVVSSYAVTVVVASSSSSAAAYFNWTITSPITISAIADQSSLENSSISTLIVSATDSISGATVSYAATGLPPGLQIDPTTGDISGTPSVGDNALGPYYVAVLAQDGTYVATLSFNWTITSLISIATPADQTNNEGDSVSLSISASDSISGATMTYAALGLPIGLNINPSTGAITGTIAVGAAANGPYSVMVAVGDGTYNNETSVSWNINSPVAFPNPPDDQANNTGDTVSVSAAASDSISGSTLSYTATALPPSLSINSSSGAITGTLTTAGFWQTVVTATDGTYSSTAAINWSVAGAISITDQGDQTNAIGDSVSVQISATDTASGTLTFSETGLPPGLSISSTTGDITGTVSSSASTTTVYRPTITVSDGTNTAIDVFNWPINPAGAIVLASPGDQTNTVGDVVSLQVSATDSANGSILFSATGLPPGLFISHDTGAIFGTISSSAASSNTVTVSASDGSNQQSITFSWTVNAAGTVSIANPGNQTNQEGDSVSLSLSSTYTGSGTLSWMAFGLPPGLKINPSTGAITGTIPPGASAGGSYTVAVVANDGSNSTAQTFTWNISSPISFNPLGDQTNNESDTVSLSTTAADASGGTVSYAAAGLPPGLSIDPSTGAITGTVAVGAAANGPYLVTVIAQDGTYSVQPSFIWNANSTVTLTTPDDQTNNESDSVTLDVSATDAVSGSTLVYAALGLPGGLSIDPSTGVISGTVAVGDAGIGSFTPTIITTDGSYSVSTTFNWTINSAITFNGPNDQANTVGDTVSLLVNASDANTSGTVTYAAIGLPAGLSINPSTGLISGTVSSGAVAIGSFVTTVFANDGTYSSSDTFNWTITAAGSVTLATPSNQTGTEGTAISTLTLSASDSTSGATVHYFAQYLPPGLELNPSTGAITGTPALGDSTFSPYQVTVTATDGTAFAQETFTWTINDPVTFSAVAANQANNEGDTPTPSFAATDATSGTLVYTATGLPPGLSISTSTGDISGTVAVGDSALSPYTVMVTANDGTYSASETLSWTITGPITLTAPADQTNLEGDSVSLTLSATDATSGATLRYSALGLPPGLKINASTGAITGTLSPGDGATGYFSVTVTVQDGTSSSSQTFNWTVAPMIAAGDFSTPENTALSVDTTDGVLSANLNGSGMSLTVSVVTNPSHGSLTLNPDGSFTYTPTTGFYGTDTFVVQASDGASNSDTVTETIDVQQDLSQSDSSFDAVATGDFNHDGNADFVAANYDLDEIYVFLGNGDGTFQTPTTYSVGAGPKALAVGNLGNGYQDIVVANSTDGTVTVLLNDGTGSFTTSQTLTVGTDPVSVALGDFLGNGSLDLAVANEGSNTVTIFLNNGSGTFTLDTTLSVGTAPDSVAAGDLNNDGYADLVVANSGDNNISVILSNGDDTFASAVNYAVGTTPTAEVLADFNGDGDLDVAVANGGSNNVSVLLGNGDGTLGTTRTYAVGSNPVALAVGNLGGDGFLDLAVMNHGSSNETVLSNAGDGTFSVTQTMMLGESPDSIAVADFENKGQVEQIVDAPILYNHTDQDPFGRKPPMPERNAEAEKLAAFQKKVDEAFTLFKDYKPALELFDKANTLRDNKIKVVAVAKLEGASADASWDWESNEIRISMQRDPDRNDIDSIVSDILFETLNALKTKDSIALEQEAKAGKVSRVDFVARTEYLEFLSAEEHHKIAEIASQKKQAGWEKADDYAKVLADWKAFMDKENAVNTEKLSLFATAVLSQMQGEENAHALIFIKIWNKKYQKAWNEKGYPEEAVLGTSREAKELTMAMRRTLASQPYDIYP